MRSLIKLLPTGTQNEMLHLMGNVAKYVAQANFSDSDYQAIYPGAAGITQLVIA